MMPDRARGPTLSTIKRQMPRTGEGIMVEKIKRAFGLAPSWLRIVALVPAALLVAGFEPRTEPFRDVTSVIVHAATIVTREVVAGPARGVVSDAPRYIAGQAGHGRGPIVLDWRTAEREIPDPGGGTNVIYHEFAHKLDQLDGVFDGMPPLGSDEGRARWTQTMGTNYRRLRRRGQDPLVRAYGATNEIEYFAVTTELFFTVPALLREHHKRVYDVLASFYNQDPA
jgi:Mlc titration factor MtfA (ptsG expression regulator)